jgi:hypothetical protein
VAGGAEACLAVGATTGWEGALSCGIVVVDAEETEGWFDVGNESVDGDEVSRTLSTSIDEAGFVDFLDFRARRGVFGGVEEVVTSEAD